jgi:hypothetical protein
VKNALANKLLRSSDDTFKYSGRRILVFPFVSATTSNTFVTAIATKMSPVASIPGRRNCVLARAASSMDVKKRKPDIRKDGLMVFRCSQYDRIPSKMLASN